MPLPAGLRAPDPTTIPILTFSGIYDVRLDSDHCLSSSHKTNRSARFPGRHKCQDFNPGSRHFSQILPCPTSPGTKQPRHNVSCVAGASRSRVSNFWALSLNPACTLHYIGAHKNMDVQCLDQTLFVGKGWVWAFFLLEGW